MKKQIVMIAAALMAVTAANAAECSDADPDSVLMVTDVDTVVVRHSPDAMTVELRGTKKNPDYYYSYTRAGSTDDAEMFREGGWNMRIPFVDGVRGKDKDKRPSTFDLEFGGIRFGFVNGVDAPAGMDVNMASSYEIAMDHILGLAVRPWRNGTSFLLGVGVQWKQYRMTGLTRFEKQGDFINLTGYPEGATDRYSRLKVFSITMPLLFRQKIGKMFNFVIGPELNFNTRASLRTKYELDGKEIVDKAKGVHQQKVTVDLMAAFLCQSVGVYVKYSPTDIFDSAYAPKFKHLSVGLAIGF